MSEHALAIHQQNFCNQFEVPDRTLELPDPIYSDKQINVWALEAAQKKALEIISEGNGSLTEFGMLDDDVLDSFFKNQDWLSWGKRVCELAKHDALELVNDWSVQEIKEYIGQ